MVSALFFAQLVLVALVWLCVMLQGAWLNDSTVTGPTPPRRKRSREPKPFAGLTRQPHCDACAHTRGLRPPAPSAPPPRIIPTRGRRRQVDTSTHFCPNPDCRYWGWAGWGNIRANGPPNGGPWRQLLCSVCRGYFLETLGTLFHGKRVAPELIVRVIACVAEGLGIRGTARVFEVDPNTVLQWLVEAAAQLQAFSRHVLHDVRVRQVQLDERFALLSAVQDGEVSAADAIVRLEHTPQWVWVAMDPESKRWLAFDVGDRTLALAQRFVHQVVQVLAPDCAPLFLTDGFRAYLTALLTHYGQWVQPPRRQAKGPMPKPRWMPRPQLLYAQVIKTTRRRHLVNVTHRVVFGSLEAVKPILAPPGWHINTAFVERINLTLRQHVAAVGRRVSTLWKGEAGLRHQLVLFQAYHSVVLPHASGSVKRWQSQTPAMAAGLTDHVWTLREVLLFRVPPWPQPARV